MAMPDVINEYDGNNVVGVNGSLNGTSLRTASSTERRQNEALQVRPKVKNKSLAALELSKIQFPVL